MCLLSILYAAKKSFYRYTLVLSVVNTLQAVGSMLWYTGRERRETGSAGIWYNYTTHMQTPPQCVVIGFTVFSLSVVSQQSLTLCI